MNITRYNPFDITRPIDEAFDNLFQGFFRPIVRGEAQAAQPRQIKLDVTENDQAYIVHAEIPGVKKEDIQVSIDGSQVSISAEVNKQQEQKDGEKVVHTERHYGKVLRSFTLAQDVDEGAAQAKYTDGVLELTLPKKAPAKAKTLTIQ